jgi:hypothetical protein
MPQQRATRTRADCAAAPAHAGRPQQLWRLLDATGSTRDLEATAMAGLSLEAADVVPDPLRKISMPAARTELSEILAADGTLCVKTRSEPPARAATKPGMEHGSRKDSQGKAPRRATVLKIHAADPSSGPPATNSNPPPADATNPLATLSNCPPAKPRPSIANASRRRDTDARLARVIDAWPTLPKTVRAAILAMIDTARECDDSG